MSLDGRLHQFKFSSKWEIRGRERKAARICLRSEACGFHRRLRPREERGGSSYCRVAVLGQLLSRIHSPPNGPANNGLPADRTWRDFHKRVPMIGAENCSVR